MHLSCLCLLTLTLAAEPDAARKDLKDMEGAWAVELLEYNGKDYTNKYKFSFEIKDGVIAIVGNDEVRKEYAKIAMKLDPSTTPKIVDMTVAVGIQKDVLMEGIYQLKGDELHLCVKVLGNKERPLEFKSPDGASVALLKLRRQK